MANRTGGHASAHESYRKTIELLAEHAEGLEEVLLGLEGLRSLGPEAAGAIEAALAVPTIRRFRLSWELFDALAEGDGADPEQLLADEMPYESIDLVRGALFGEGPGAEPPAALALVPPLA
jgi:hypothetical protein